MLKHCNNIFKRQILWPPTTLTHPLECLFLWSEANKLKGDQHAEAAIGGDASMGERLTLYTPLWVVIKTTFSQVEPKISHILSLLATRCADLHLQKVKPLYSQVQPLVIFCKHSIKVKMSQTRSTRDEMADLQGWKMSGCTAAFEMRQIRELWITVNLNLELLPLEGRGHRLDSCLPRKHFHFLEVSCSDNSGCLVVL